MSWCGIFHNCTCAFAETHLFQGSKPLFKSCCVPYGTYWFILTQNKWHNACAFAEQTKKPIILCRPIKSYLFPFSFYYCFQFQTSNCWYKNAPFLVDLQQKRDKSPDEWATTKQVCRDEFVDRHCCVVHWSWEITLCYSLDLNLFHLKYAFFQRSEILLHVRKIINSTSFWSYIETRQTRSGF